MQMFQEDIHYQFIIKAIDKERYDTVIFNLESREDNYMTNFYFGLAFLGKSKRKKVEFLNKAIHYFKKSIKARDYDPETHFQLAIAFQTKGELLNDESSLEEAIKEYNQAQRCCVTYYVKSESAKIDIARLLRKNLGL